jgi:hypothetical protein
VSGLSVRAYARVRGVSHVAVLKAIKNRRISQNADGTIDPDKANQEWDRNTFAGRTMVAPSPAADLSRGVAPLPAAGDTLALYQKAKAKKAVFESLITELEFNQRSGKLIEATTAGEYASSLSNILRDQVSAWPDRLTPMLAATTDETAVHRILAREGDALLRKVSKAIADAGY